MHSDKQQAYVEDDLVDELEQLVLVREVVRDLLGEDRHVRVVQLEERMQPTFSQPTQCAVSTQHHSTHLSRRVAQRRVVDRFHDVQHELLAEDRLGDHDTVHLGHDL